MEEGPVAVRPVEAKPDARTVSKPGPVAPRGDWHSVESEGKCAVRRRGRCCCRPPSPIRVTLDLHPEAGGFTELMADRISDSDVGDRLPSRSYEIILLCVGAVRAEARRHHAGGEAEQRSDGEAVPMVVLSRECAVEVEGVGVLDVRRGGLSHEEERRDVNDDGPVASPRRERLPGELWRGAMLRPRLVPDVSVGDGSGRERLHWVRLDR